jgi:ABC-type lipoprotein export system ATPase subunit
MSNQSQTKRVGSPKSSPPLVQARDLAKHYYRGQEQVEALSGVTLELETGRFAFVVGPSGSGKSTLLHLLGGIDRPTSGSLIVNGVSLAQAKEASLATFRRDNIGFVFQFYNLLPALNAQENVALPLLARGMARQAALERAKHLLNQVGLADRRHHKPAQLSGGEQQRVAIARAVIGEPSLVLADEPTGDLDKTAAQSIMALMLELNQRLGTTFLVATHNEALCSLGDQTWTLQNGQLVS